MGTNVFGFFDVVILTKGKEKIILPRSDFASEAITFFNLHDDAFEEFFEFLKIRGSEMVVRLEISGSVGKIVFEYSRDGCEKRISFKYLEGDAVKIEATGRGDCAGFEFKVRGEADAVNRFLDMVAQEFGLENALRLTASMWGLENFGGVPKAFMMPLALDPSTINIRVVKNDSPDNASGDAGSEER